MELAPWQVSREHFIVPSTISEDGRGAEAFIDGVHRLWSHPEIRGVLVKLCSAFEESAPGIVKSARSVDWRQVDSTALVYIGELWWVARENEQVIFPATTMLPPATPRRFFYVQYLLLAGLFDWLAARTPDPLTRVAMLLWIAEAAPNVIDEAVRRSDKPDFDAITLDLFRRDGAEKTPDKAAEFWRTFTRLRRAGWPRGAVLKAMQRDVGKRVRSRSKVPQADAQTDAAVRGAVETQILLTLAELCAGRDLVDEILPRALDGTLGAITAIQHDLLDPFRGPRVDLPAEPAIGLDEGNIPYDERGRAERTRQRRAREEVLRVKVREHFYRQPDKEKELLERQLKKQYAMLKRLAAKRPALARKIRACLTPGSLTDVARKFRTDPRTIMRWRSEIKQRISRQRKKSSG